uniref:Uncharacterized protein n=1 Tax=viral metagenome TaxID=1070528 RepID=A0A6C0M3U4_9ZZZZ
MSGFFQDVMGNLDDVQQKLLGPDYKYFQQIKTPSELGVSGNGGLDQLGTDISALISYVELLVSGGGDASVTGRPLGNKFFLKTGGKCKVVSSDSTNGSVVDRYVYVNNVPDGNIPFISSGLGGVEFTAFKGLIPGAISSAAEINPFGLFQAFQMGSTPDCQSITLETIDANNNVSAATNYVATVDLKNMPPSWFSGKRNPVTGKVSREAFAQRTPCTKRMGSIPKGTLSSLYHMSIGLLCLVILYGLTKRMSK